MARSPTCFLILYVGRMDSQSTILVGSGMCAVMAISGVCESGTRKLDKNGMSRANSFSSAPGGGTLPLLQKSGIPEGRGYAGFPVSGIWLRCDRPEICSRHHAKVYGKAGVGITSNVRAPPRYAAHRRESVIAFRPLRGLFNKISQAWILSRSFRRSRSRKLAAASGGRDG